MSIESIKEKMMTAFATTMPTEIDHALNVLKNAEIIMSGEVINERDKNRVIITALLHDIGMISAKEKYGSTVGPLQEKEGPKAARAILVSEAIEEEDIDRICYIIGHHHTIGKVDGLDFQIIWEADILEALKKGVNEFNTKTVETLINNNFKTKSGIALARRTLLSDYN